VTTSVAESVAATGRPAETPRILGWHGPCFVLVARGTGIKQEVFPEVELEQIMVLVPYPGASPAEVEQALVLLDAQDGTRLPHELVTLLGLDLAAALEHAHAPGGHADGAEVNAIVHRDISPGNVLISRRGEVLLSDFGVAKAISGTSRKQSAVKGKVPYMSPEQLRAEPLDGRADLFALGVVLFEALGGQRPYDGAHDPATIMLTLSGDHPSLHGLAPDAPPGLCDVIESLLRSDRDERPNSASALIDLLDEYAPSPRARRAVGKLVAECRPAEDRISTEDALALAAGAAATDALPEAGGTGAQRTVGAPAIAGTTPLGSRGRGSGSRPKRRPERKHPAKRPRGGYPDGNRRERTAGELGRRRRCRPRGAGRRSAHRRS
jgi:hypothetical protein